MTNTKPEIIRARAPGKIIISGEHSVVYGAQALAMAVDEYTTVSFSPISQSKTINTIFSGISSSVIYPINALSKLKHHLDERFEQFSQGKFPVQNILNHPNDLVMYALMSLLHQLPSREMLKKIAPESGVLRSESSIPTGAGMGSSASAIAATLVLYEHILGKPLSKEQRFDMVKFCERLQHGKGSAIDAATVTFGGLIHLRDGMPQQCDAGRNDAHVALGQYWYWINTGSPLATTGECVQHVRKKYAYDTALWESFNQLTGSLIASIQQGAVDTALIQENHRLLTHIDVVPEKAQTLISLVEECGGVAKTSGAGSAYGDKAGVILAYLPNGIEPVIERCQTELPGYIQSWNSLSGDYQGACLQ